MQSSSESPFNQLSDNEINNKTNIGCIEDIGNVISSPAIDDANQNIEIVDVDEDDNNLEIYDLTKDDIDTGINTSITNDTTKKEKSLSLMNLYDKAIHDVKRLSLQHRNNDSMLVYDDDDVPSNPSYVEIEQPLNPKQIYLHCFENTGEPVDMKKIRNKPKSAYENIQIRQRLIDQKITDMDKDVLVEQRSKYKPFPNKNYYFLESGVGGRNFNRRFEKIMRYENEDIDLNFNDLITTTPIQQKITPKKLRDPKSVKVTSKSIEKKPKLSKKSTQIQLNNTPPHSKLRKSLKRKSKANLRKSHEFK
ncbi:hypothetical protein QTN25_004364 [Entamoeba marina]